ncbi:MAG TPA: hypothetical protein VI544_00255 [Candidatus Nanoarchaeia archaeon]|nr:hypothetical protein [Candidatus Nanoarchaeia archaeon]
MAARKFCPKCESENVVVEGSMIEFSGGAMVCKDCGYKDVNFPQKEKIIKEDIKK